MTKKPLVLFCINKLGSGSGLGGAERLVVDDINEMISQGHIVRLLTLKKESEFSMSKELRLPKEDWTVIDFGSLFNVSDWIKVYKYVKREKPDIVFTHLWFTNTIVRVVCKIAGIKDIFSFEHNIYDTVKTKKMYFVDKFLQSWSRKIVAVSGAVKKSLVEHGIKEERIVVINNGIDIHKYQVNPDPSLRESLGIPKGFFVFLSIGRLIEQKGMDILIEAFSKLSESSFLLIAGQGKEEKKLKKLAQNLKVKERINFLAIRKDIPELLAASDAFVLASRYEGQGIVILEAMAASRPIVVSDFDAVSDMITSGEEGLIVKRENPIELSFAMDKLMSDRNLRESLAQKARKKVENFSIQNHVNKILSLLP